MVPVTPVPYIITLRKRIAMRYSDNENTYLLGKFNPNDTVDIKVLDLSTDVLLEVSTTTCVESGNIPGLFMWNTSNIINSTNGLKNIYYVMTNGTTTFDGKFVFGGYPDKDVSNDLFAAGFDPQEILKILRIINGRL